MVAMARKNSIGFALTLALTLALAEAPAAAWTDDHQLTVAWEAARLGPRDLYRQLLRHRADFEAGVLAPGRRCDGEAEGSGGYAKSLGREVEQAVRDIRAHRPFPEVVRRLGVIARCLADANNPLAGGDSDPDEGRYAADFDRYVASAQARFPLLFYGLKPELERARDLGPLLAETAKRGRFAYPRIGQEYRRIDYGSGAARFDDRSTAFGVASVSFSHAVTDTALALRYVWLRAGGGDERTALPREGQSVLLLKRAGRPEPGGGALGR
jgi:hypothetical protein